MSSVRLHRAGEAECAYVERLLTDADLPTAGVRNGPGRFYVARADGERVGCVGLEPAADSENGGVAPDGDTDPADTSSATGATDVTEATGATDPTGTTGATDVTDASATHDALLRSLVVEPDRRGDGIGTAVCEAATAAARAAGIDRVFLLTTTAADFFAARGFERIAREAVPDGVRHTREFTDLCPETATVMWRRP